MRHLHHLPLLFLPANLALAQILVFNETTGLPACAYDCNPLWAAQFACSGRTSDDAVRCFCVEVGWVQGGSGGGGSGNGSGWGSCDSACGDPGGGRVRVKEWLGRVCGVGSGDNSPGSGDNSRGSGEVRNDSGGGGNGNSTRPPGDNVANITDPSGPAQGAADQATKARAWWKKNYPFFILAFLVVTVPILLYAFAVPIRKWAKRQIVKNRPRRQSNMEQLGSGGFVFPRSGGGSAVWAIGAPTSGSCGSFVAGGGGGGGGGGSRRGSAANALDGPSSSGVFTTEVLPPPQQPPRDSRVSARQASWERRARAQFSRGNGFRLKFWKKAREGDEEG